MQSDLQVSKENIDEFCRRWRVEELTIDRDRWERPVADPGLRVKFDPLAEWSFADCRRMEREFQLLSGKEINVRRRSLAPASRSRRTMQVLYTG